MVATSPPIEPTKRALTKAHIAVGGTGWTGVVLLLADKLEEYLNPTTVHVLAAQYTENLRIIAESCNNMCQ